MHSLRERELVGLVAKGQELAVSRYLRVLSDDQAKGWRGLNPLHPSDLLDMRGN